MMQTTTPVPVEGGVVGGALPRSAGTSFHGRRKPNGSACQRRTMGIGDGGYVPCITLTGSGVKRAQARLADRRGEHRPEPVLSEPHRLRAATDPPSE